MMAMTRSALALVVVASSACQRGSPSASYPLPPPPTLTDGEVEGTQPREVQVGVEADAYADTDPSALTDFRAPLDAHGAWVDDPNYGTVWVPNRDEVGADFMPYDTAGHWDYDSDYVWVSDYDWGWAPFHYGRWVWIASRGWAWIPGRSYAGAWVDWRMGDDDYPYVGWAPMAPAWIWWAGVALGLGASPSERFVFSPRTDIFSPIIATHLVPAERAAIIIGHTRTYVAAGPHVNGNPLAQPVMHGPSPALLGIDLSRVPRPTQSERGLWRAQQFARPSTAQNLGAHAAVPHVVRTVPRLIVQGGPQAPHAPAARGGGRHR
jgi:hypothetical protein